VTVERRHLGRYCLETVTAGSGKQGRRKAVAFPLTFQKRDNWGKGVFFITVSSDFMAYHDRIETNFL